MGQTLFVVWREAMEALLVIGILYAWLNSFPEGKKGKRYLLLGVALGSLLAVFLAASIYGLSNLLSGDSYDLFLIAMQLTAAVLIVQMVYWMNQHGRHLKQHLENDLSQHVKQANWLGITFITAIAIAREGSEIVVFLSSTIFSLTATTLLPFLLTCALGLLLAFVTFYIFQFSQRWLSWSVFFKITTAILLCLGASLFLKGMEGAFEFSLNYDWNVPNLLLDPAWDISATLDDSSPLGSLLASLFAYRAMPAWFSVLSFALYWLAVYLLFKVIKPRRNNATQPQTQQHT
ncbi:MAG: FTR1 family protein [Pseudomonas sp.]|nr:FTR1 family protein [Pseudomonas sp.]